MFMAISDIFQKKDEEKPVRKSNHTFTDANREKARIRREDNARFRKAVQKRENELKLLDLELQKREKIAQIKEVGKPLLPDEDDSDDYDDDYEDDYDSEDDTPEDKLMRIIEKAIPGIDEKPKEKKMSEYTPQEIVQMIPPHVRKFLKSKTPAEIKELARMNYPDIPPPTIEAVIPLL